MDIAVLCKSHYLHSAFTHAQDVSVVIKKISNIFDQGALTITLPVMIFAGTA